MKTCIFFVVFALALFACSDASFLGGLGGGGSQQPLIIVVQSGGGGNNGGAAGAGGAGGGVTTAVVGPVTSTFSPVAGRSMDEDEDDNILRRRANVHSSFNRF